MSDQLQSAATICLSDPPYYSVFKHTLDLVGDYVSYGLVTVGALSLSVRYSTDAQNLSHTTLHRFLTTLGSGDITCFLTGVENSSQHGGELGPFPGSMGYPMVGYANYHKECIDSVLTPFYQYLPYAMLLQVTPWIIY